MKTKFEMQREKAMRQLAEARNESKADVDIAGLVDAINAHRDYYTTSSCAGRICILQTPMVHDKLESEWLGKWHRTVRLDETLAAIRKNKKDVAYLQAECPILHVVARDLHSASRLLQLARECGFKRSGIQSVNPERVMLEILSTEHLEVPVAHKGRQLVSEEYLKFLVRVANAKLRAGRKKIRRLEKLLAEDSKIGPNTWPSM